MLPLRHVCLAIALLTGVLQRDELMASPAVSQYLGQQQPETVGAEDVSSQQQSEDVEDDFS